MALLNDLLEHKTDFGLLFIGDTPVTHHCHHFNLFLDQTVEDAFGEEEGFKIKVEAAHQAYYRLLKYIQEKLNLETKLDKLNAFGQIFSEMGQGKLLFDSDENGGKVIGTNLHYSLAWRKKYGEQVKKRTPIDAVAAGFAAAALELAHNLPFGTFSAKEEKCYALRDKQCEFVITREDKVKELPPLHDIKFSEDQYIGELYAEDKIKNIANGLKTICEKMIGDERGVIEGFGVYINLQAAEYYNKISYETIKTFSSRMPESIQLIADLFKESGQVCGFNTMAAIILSPEWEALFGKISGKPEDVVIAGVGIARALGFGNWGIEHLEPNRVVLRKTTSYESAYLKEETHRPAKSENGHCYLFQGTGEAIMRLARLVDWKNPPKFDQQFYNSLFKGKNRHCCEVRETKCIGNGDPYCELEIKYLL